MTVDERKIAFVKEYNNLVSQYGVQLSIKTPEQHSDILICYLIPTIEPVVNWTDPSSISTNNLIGESNVAK